MSKEMTLTNSEDLYLIDEQKKIRLEEWLTHNEEESVESFILHFPEDFVVQKYEANECPVEFLSHHIDVLKSKLPVSVYFERAGITPAKIVDKLANLMESKDEGIALKTLNLIIKLKYPEEKPMRVNPTQININNFDNDERKELMNRVIENMRVLND